MTENAANMDIKYAVCVLEAIGNGLTLSNENDREDACVLAIKSIDELQQYRAIGTAEGYECAIKSSIDNYNLYREYKAKVQDFELIGTAEEFKALKEKNTSMELAEHNFQDEVHHYLCPSCRGIVNCNQNYCEECGQALET